MKHSLFLIAAVMLFAASCASVPSVDVEALHEAADAWSWPDPARYEKAIAAFEAQDAEAFPPAGAVIGIGSSSMRGWHKWIDEDLEPLTVIPRGFGGSDMYDVLSFADRVVIPYKPRAIILYEGDNDIAAKLPPEAVHDAFRALVAKVHAELPEARVYFLSIKPSISRWSMWPEMAAANDLIRVECAKDERLLYVDIATPMLGENGEPKPEIFLKDNLHMNRAGYDIWRDVARDVIVPAETPFE